MASLLHIDSSINGDNSHSRKVTATFAEEWRKANPQGDYAYRDLAAAPIPYLDGLTYSAHQVDSAQHSPEQAAAYAATKPIGDEVEAADTILLGTPMYNFGVPANLKTWLDHIAFPRFFADQETGKGALTGKKIVVATSRGGSYAPGTPRESFDHQEPYLKSFFTFLGAGEDITFIHTEMALSLVVPQLADFKHIYEQTHAAAHETARKLASV